MRELGRAVHIELAAIELILSAAAEVWNQECLGLLCGHRPTRRYPYFRITKALIIQKVKRRLNTEVTQSERSYRRLKRFLEANPRLYPVFGDVHSHPATGKWRRPFNLSDEDDHAENNDIRGMRAEVREARKKGEDDRFVWVVVNVALRTKNTVPWRLVAGGTRFRGSSGDYRFHFHAYTMRDDAEGVPQPVRLPLTITPATLKALDRDQHRQKSD